MLSFAGELSENRKLKGLSQASLARAISYDRSYISKLESGERFPSDRDVVLRITRFLKTDDYISNKLLVLANFEPQLDSRENYKACLRLIEEFKQKGLLDKAKTILQTIKQQSRNKFELSVILAYSCLLEKDYNRSIELYENAIENYESENYGRNCITKAEAIHNLGNVYFERGLEAKSQLEQGGLNHQEGAAPGLLRENALNDFYLAIEKFNFALALQPGHDHIIDQLARIYLNLSSLYSGRQRETCIRQAINYYGKIIESANAGSQVSKLKRQEASVYASLCYARLSDFGSARILINTIISNNQAYAAAYYIKACIYSMSAACNYEEMEIAYLSLQQAVKLNSGLKGKIKASNDLLNLRESKSFGAKVQHLYEE